MKRTPHKAIARFADQRGQLADAVWRQPGIGQLELAILFGWCPQVLKRVINSLLEDGVIIRTSGPDRRQNYYMQGY